jgi:hypothetical protein
VSEIELDETVKLAIQHAVAQYTIGVLAAAMVTMQEA